MGLIFADSFDHYNQAYIQSKWTSIFNFGTANQGLQLDNIHQRTGTQCAAFTGNGGFVTIKNASTWIHGAAFNFTQYGGGISYSHIGTIQVQWTINPDGTLSVFNGPHGLNPGVLLGVTDPALAILLGRYYFIEFKAVINQSAGQIVVRINGQTVLTLSSVNTSPNGDNIADVVQVTGPGGNAFVYVDDMYVLDDSGTKNNDLIGDQQIGLIMPASDGDFTDWTPSTPGPHFSLVNEIPPDGDASYVWAVAPTVMAPFPIDCYHFQTVDPTRKIAAIQTNIIARKSDTGNRALSVLTRFGGSNSVADSGGRYVNETYIDYRNCFDVNPLTTSPWTPADVNATQWGYQLIV
jgi:hypothetical protein